MGTFFFFVAMVFGVLPFVTGLILGRPMQALVAGVIAVLFLWQDTANVRASAVSRARAARPSRPFGYPPALWRSGRHLAYTPHMQAKGA